ncbi:DNRLRE domain-containing protein [Bhargavaea cecembensis]|uniref:DNRLRE domain-containing protein n=1 Tax=Bhargavaea cecembensis TaxID=394098 RepID=UPI00058D7CF2|nr:DNRLRE domain-containing protein [Bhargavaea cecembensis]
MFLIQKPFMYDSNHEAAPEGVISQEVSQDIEKTDEGFLLTVTADEAFLQSPDTVYPVTIDPWIDVFQGEDTFVASGTNYNYHNTDYLFAGNHSAIGKTRSLLKFNLPTVPNGVVTGASLGLYQVGTGNTSQIDLHKLTSSFNATTVNWATQPSYLSTPLDSNKQSAEAYQYFKVTDAVKGWYDNPATNFGVMAKYPDSVEGTAARKSFHSSEWVNPDGSPFGKPKLYIEFRPTELLGLTDYWAYTPDVFQGEGTAVVNVINGNMVYDLALIDVAGLTEAFDLGLTYNSRSNYNTHFGLGWMFNSYESLAANSDQSIIEYRTGGGARYHFAKQQHDDGMTYSSPEGVSMN